MTRIAVVGGTGFIGSALVRRLVARGDAVTVVTAHPDRSEERIRAAGAEAVFGDVQRAETLATALRDAEVVVQSLSFPSFPVEKPAKGWTFTEFEDHGTARLVQAAVAAGARRFVYVSGVGVAPDAPKVWHRAKWAGEQHVLAAGIASTIVRPSWVYGQRDNSLNRFVTFARWSPFVPVLGSGDQRINPVWVEDVAAVLERATATDGPTGVFEIGGPQVLTMREVLATMLEVMERRKPLVGFPVALPKLAGLFLQVLPKPPLSPDAVDFATGEAIADTGPLVAAFAPRLTPLREGLATYLARR